MIKDFFLLKHKDLLVQVYLDVFCVWDLVQSIILYNTLPINNRSVVGCKLKVMGTRLIRNQDKQKNKGNLIIVMSNFAKKEGGGAKLPLVPTPIIWGLQVWRNLLKDDGASILTSGYCPPHLKCYILSVIIVRIRLEKWDRRLVSNDDQK